MSSDQYVLQRYLATAEEVCQLRAFATQWHQDGEFWSFDDSVRALSQNTSVMFALRKFPKNEFQQWLAVAFYQVVMDEADLVYVYVPKAFRGKRYGIRVMEESLKEINDQGVKKVTLEVRVTNKIAQNLYLDLGFLEIGRRPRYYGGVEDALIMQKDL